MSPIGATISLAELERDPDPIMARLRADEPVSWVPALEMWLVTRWSDVEQVEADPDTFRAATEPSFLARALGENMLTSDPPEHTRLQTLFRPPFLAGDVAGDFTSNRLANLADRLLDEIDTSAPFDLMQAYAQPLAAAALADVLGLDAHGWQAMWGWCEGLCTDIANFENDPELTCIGAAAKAELGAALRERIAAVGAGTEAVDRAIGSFVRAGATTDEIVNNVRLMISGGINEPRDGIGLMMWTLLSRPELAAQVDADPTRIRRLMEEVFRRYSPVGTITRQATVDVELGGASIKAGDLVSGVLRSINLDEARWERPLDIDLARREGGHAAFALGTHRCLGEWLGRQEVRVGVERLRANLPTLRLVDGAPVELHGFEFRGPRSVMVEVG